MEEVKELKFMKIFAQEYYLGLYDMGGDLIRNFQKDVDGLPLLLRNAGFLFTRNCYWLNADDKSWFGAMKVLYHDLNIVEDFNFQIQLLRTDEKLRNNYKDIVQIYSFMTGVDIFKTSLDELKKVLERNFSNPLEKICCYALLFYYIKGGYKRVK